MDTSDHMCIRWIDMDAGPGPKLAAGPDGSLAQGNGNLAVLAHLGPPPVGYPYIYIHIYIYSPASTNIRHKWIRLDSLLPH